MKKSSFFRLFVLVAAMMCALGASAIEAYACYTSSNTTLTFYYDNYRSSRQGTTYDLNTGDYIADWIEHSEVITKVVFDPSFANARPTTTYDWFYYMCNLQSIDGLSYLNTSEVTNMAIMFYACDKLTSIDVSHFDTSKVTDMKYMFSNCFVLGTLDVSHFNTSKVTDMSFMFAYCHELRALDVSNFNTSNVTDMNDMFLGCNKLGSLDVSNFNMSKVENMSYMFAGCKSLTTLDVSHFNTSSATDMRSMFYECESLSSLDLSSFNTSSVENMRSMFYDCSSLQSIYVSSGWNTASVNVSNNMFYGCVNIIGEQGTTYDANHVDASYAHIDGGSSNPGYLSFKPFVFEEGGIYYTITGSNTVAVTYKDENYNSYSGGVTIPATVTHGGTTYDVTAIGDDAFRGCTGLTQLTIPGSVTSIGHTAFYRCTSLRAVECLAVTPPAIFSDTFSRYSATIYVPRGSVSAYQTATYWRNFSSIVEISLGTFEKDGICYAIISANTVAVTFRNTNYNSYSGEVTIPETVTNDGTTYDVTAIGTRAFYNCTGLTKVTIPGSVTSIGEYAFYHCRNLDEVTIPDGVTTIGGCAFLDCMNLYRVIIGSGVTSIGDEAFADLANLDMVVCYAETPPAIQNLTFDNHGYSNANLYVPKASMSAYRSAQYWENFNYVRNIYSYDFEQDGFYYAVQPDGESVYVTRHYNAAFDEDAHVYTEREYNIPETVTYRGKTYTVTGIDRLAFWECTNLEHISLPKTIQEIGERAFDRCTNLYSFCCHAMTPPTIGYGIFDESVAGDVLVGVPNSAFSAYEQTEGWNELALSELDYDFEQDGFFYRITGDNTVAVTQKEHHFNHLVYKGNVDIPWRVTYQGKIYWLNSVYDDAFVNCRDLTAVNIPNTGWVRTIGNSAFMYCTGLKRVTIPQSVTTIKNSAFSGCTSLETITCNAWTPPTIYTATFPSYVYNNATLRVPRGTKSSYQSKNYWKNFLNIEEFYDLNEALNVEDGDLEFESDGIFAWTTVDEGDRVYAVSGNKGVPNSTSLLTAQVYVEENSILSFDFKAWGESFDGYAYDCCIFLIDGVEQFRYGARDNNWETFIVELEPGEHMLEWSYEKDDMFNPAGDYFAVDNVQIKTNSYEAYACYTSSNTTLTFYYDNQRSSRPGTTYDLNTGNNHPGWETDGTNANVTKVVFDPSFANARPTTTYSWFCDMGNLQSITGISYLNTSEVTNMVALFANCKKMTNLDLSHFNTSKVTDMTGMFDGCSGLTSLDLSSFNTSKVTKMIRMFYGNRNLRTIYVGNGWSTEAVTSSTNMFIFCTNLVGGQGTTYDVNYIDKTYAHIDGGPSNPGYFTDKNASLRGDVNGDGSVNISDVTALIDYLLSGNPSGVNLTAADCNQDSSVNISDVTSLIDYLLSGTW